MPARRTFTSPAANPITPILQWHPMALQTVIIPHFRWDCWVSRVFGSKDTVPLDPPVTVAARDRTCDDRCEPGYGGGGPLLSY